MKYLIPFLLLILSTACNNLDIEFTDNHAPVFYVYAESGQPVYAYVTESANTDVAEFAEIDTSRTILQMGNNGTILEIIKPAFFDTLDLESFPNVLQLGSVRDSHFKSNTILNSTENYTFLLKYKDYADIELSATIPESLTIDSFNITPNIAYSHGDYFIQHNLHIRFKPPERNGHFCVNVFYDYTDTTGQNEGRSIRDGFGMAKFYQENEVLTNSEFYSLNYTMLSERHSGDFVPVIYLINISDDSYNYVMQEMAFIEYRESAGLFKPMPAHTPYSMVPNAYANVFAYSTTKDTGDVIQVTEPIITDYKIIENK